MRILNPSLKNLLMQKDETYDYQSESFCVIKAGAYVLWNLEECLIWKADSKENTFVVNV